MDPVPLKQSSESGRILLYPLLKPNPDLARMSRTLVTMVIRQLEERRRGGTEPEDGAPRAGDTAASDPFPGRS